MNIYKINFDSFFLFRSLSQDFRGFDVQDVQESQMHLPTAKIHSSDAEVLQEKFEDDPKVSQPDVQQSNTSKSTEIESAQKLVSKSIAMVIDVDEEKRSFVEDIVEKVVEGITKVNEDVQVADMVDNRKNLDGMHINVAHKIVGNRVTYCRSCCSHRLEG